MSDAVAETMAAEICELQAKVVLEQQKGETWKEAAVARAAELAEARRKVEEMTRERDAARSRAIDEAARVAREFYDDLENACEHGCEENYLKIEVRIRELANIEQLVLL